MLYPDMIFPNVELSPTGSLRELLYTWISRLMYKYDFIGVL
jgi:hypothetical protein